MQGDTSDDLAMALVRMQPNTKAARIRALLPMIEQQLRNGVRIADIATALSDAGLVLSVATLKNYLHRERRKRARGPQGTGTASRPSVLSSVSATPPMDTAVPAGPVSPQDLDRLMRPDPDTQAAEMADYERRARQRRREGQA